MEIILYTSHCPMCRGIETLLKLKKIEYKEVTDLKVMLSKGLQSAPALEVDGVLFVGAKAARDKIMLMTEGQK